MAATMMPSSMPPPPPPAMVTSPLQPDYQGSFAAPEQSHGGSGSSSIGTFFAVLAAVLVLTLLSCIFGRVCARHADGPDERYDCARLARRWCCWGPPRRRVVRREAKPSPPVVEEVPAAALPPPEP
ncbi:hypothetical protein E2562_028918 [Oryza meyeriana var. granulata]|uniref:Uncharacterized protein n=1 Tax=Oryza meyeriana var. granulata TaxID=110450 RepID=A0A6G1FDR0_9ORYZ|nr:hypothetical protein E2562_028918 [Oryza meyeriana var. granulata]